MAHISGHDRSQTLLLPEVMVTPRATAEMLPGMAFDPLPAPTPAAAEALPAELEAEIATARGYVDASRAASTRKAYDADWRRFTAWCRVRNPQDGESDEGEAPALPACPLPAPPALVAIYLSVLASHSLAPPSVARALAAMAHVHKRGKQPRPGVTTACLEGGECTYRSIHCNVHTYQRLRPLALPKPLKCMHANTDRCIGSYFLLCC